MTRYSHSWMKLGLALALSGCTLSNEDVVPGGGDDVTPPPHELTTYDIRNPDSEYHPAEGTAVTLEGKVVTAVLPFDTGNNRQSFWIAEPEGGQWSGIYVYDSGKRGLPVTVGDVVTVKGTYSEYLPSLSDLTVSEIGYTEMTVESSGAKVPVYPYPAGSLADIATGGALAEAFESVLLEVDAPLQVTELTDPVHNEFKVGTNLANSVRVDDSLYPEAAVGRVVGQSITVMRAVLWYTYNDFKLEPRDKDDLVAGEVAYSDASVYQLRDRTAPDAVTAGAPVRLGGMVVTGVSGTGTGSFFMQLPAARYRTAADASYSAIYANRGTASGNTVVHVGDVVTVEGAYTESVAGVSPEQSQGQVTVSSVTVNGTAAVPVATVVAPAAIATGGSDAEKYESVLVRVEGVTVTAKSDSNKEFVVDGSLHIDDYLYAGASTTGDGAFGLGPIHFIQGPLNFYAAVSKIVPRSAADIDTTPATTVYAIRQQDVPGATTYAVPGVVITALVEPDGTGDFFVQVPEAEQDATLGAKYSAMYVARAAGATNPVVMGELVSVIGQYSGGGDPYAPTVFEASSVYVDPARTAPVPAPTVIADPFTIATGGVDAIAYESALVEVDDVALVDANPDAPADNGEFMVDGDLRVDDLLSSTADRYGRLATSFQYLRGVLYSEGGEFRLEPRSTVDMLRNSIPATVKTVYELQDPADAGMPAMDAQVQIEHVVVTAVVGDGYGSFWVQMPESTLDARGHAYSGIFCDRGASNTGAQRVQAGDLVTVAGQYIEETDLDPVSTALLVDAAGVTYEGSGAPLPAAEAIADPATLSVDATAEAWESVLVSISDVVVLDANPDAPADHGETLVGNVGATDGVRIDDILVHDLSTTVRRAVAGLSSVTGVLTQVGPTYQLEPRDVADVLTNPIPDMSIYDLQDPAASPAVGTGARITGVVSGYVTSTGPYWVQVADSDRDPTLGAQYSGIYCAPTAVSLVDGATVRVGDVVTLEGTYTEDAGLSTFLVTEVTKPGTTGTVTAVTADLGDLEPYEGVLVSLGAVDVTVPNPDDPDLDEFIVTGDLRVGSMILPSAALLGRTTTGFTSVTGLLHFSGGQFKVEPRTGADLVAATPYVLTPYVIQDPAYRIASGITVHIDDLVVTAVAGDTSFFAQLATPDPVRGTGFSGIYVYQPATAVARGDLVSVEGKLSEFNGLTEIARGATVTIVSSDYALPAPTVVPAASIATDGVDAERYESVLVRVEDVGVQTENPDLPSDYGELEVTGGLRVDDTLWRYDAALLRSQAHFTYIQGPLYYSYGDTKLEPRDASDVQYP